MTAYATWCALREAYGQADWPPELTDHRSPAVAEFAAEHAEVVEFHCWLQWVMDEQLGATQAEAVRAGMALGVCMIWPSGCIPMARTPGASGRPMLRPSRWGPPPDPYNQNGQDWTQPRGVPTGWPERDTRLSGRWSRPSSGTRAGSASTT